jgi:hypothetical protein
MALLVARGGLIKPPSTCMTIKSADSAYPLPPEGTVSRSIWICPRAPRPRALRGYNPF